MGLIVCVCIRWKIDNCIWWRSIWFVRGRWLGSRLIWLVISRVICFLGRIIVWIVGRKSRIVVILWFQSRCGLWLISILLRKIVSSYRKLRLKLIYLEKNNNSNNNSNNISNSSSNSSAAIARESERISR